MRRIVVCPAAGFPAGTRARANAAGLSFPATLGRAGRTVLKMEGDGATPVARMRLIEGFYRADRAARPPTRLAMTPIRADDAWCDAPAHACYNRQVRLPFSASRETMRRADRLYDICLVLDWNYRGRRRGRGSAIFLHLTAPDGAATEGCIAIEPDAMRRLLAVVGPRTTVEVR